MNFDHAPSALRQALDARGYTSPTPVQAAVADPALRGQNLLVSARTGSGKTVAFGLAAAPELLGPGGHCPPPAQPLALVIAPTRELAQQVERELTWLYATAGGRLLCCVGGTDFRRQLRGLQAGAHVVVGTPGRLRDLMERGALDLSAVRVVVLDEADEMLDLGFRDELEALLGAAPAKRRTFLFSATLPPEILSLAERFAPGAARVAVAADEAHADISYKALVCAAAEREHAVINLLRAEDADRALVFVGTREGVTRLHSALLERGFQATALSGDYTQNERFRSLQALRDGRARVLVATDVAARGLDIPTLGLVIHADLPADPAVLLHRSGRTGRAGHKGTAVLLVPASRRRIAQRLVQQAKVAVEWGHPPTADEVRALDQERLAARLAPTGEAADEDLAVARTLLAAHDAERLVAAFVASRREELPAPEELVETQRIAQPPAPRPRTEPRPDLAEGEAVWFAIDKGRWHKALPSGVLAYLCRRTGVTREVIGRILIFDTITRFEVAGYAADAFEQAFYRARTPGDAMRLKRWVERPGGPRV
jgi:ATP-dependent RNA helicase DeaD